MELFFMMNELNFNIKKKNRKTMLTQLIFQIFRYVLPK